MSKKTNKQFEKQYKYLKKSLKAEFKQARKLRERKPLEGNHDLMLTKKQLKTMAKEMVYQLLASNDGIAARQVVHQITPAPSNMGFALKPYKKSPCKGCPARSGGLCQCALKQAKKQRVG